MAGINGDPSYCSNIQTFTIPNNTRCPAKDCVNLCTVAQLEQREKWTEINDLLHFTETQMLGSQFKF